jgi:hypothetical protein
VIVEFLKGFQKRRAEFSNDPARVEQILTKSEEKARIIASKNLSEIQQAMGLR